MADNRRRFRGSCVVTRERLLTLVDDLISEFPNGWERWQPGELRELKGDLGRMRLIKREKSTRRSEPPAPRPDGLYHFTPGSGGDV